MIKLFKNFNWKALGKAIGDGLDRAVGIPYDPPAPAPVAEEKRTARVENYFIKNREGYYSGYSEQPMPEPTILLSYSHTKAGYDTEMTLTQLYEVLDEVNARYKALRDDEALYEAQSPLSVFFNRESDELYNDFIKPLSEACEELEKSVRTWQLNAGYMMITKEEAGKPAKAYYPGSQIRRKFD